MKGISGRRESWVVSLSFPPSMMRPPTQVKRKVIIFMLVIKAYFSTHPYFCTLLHNSGAGTLKISLPLAVGFLLLLYQQRQRGESWKRGEDTYSILTAFAVPVIITPCPTRFLSLASVGTLITTPQPTVVPAPSKLSHFLSRRGPVAEILNSDNYCFFPLFPRLSI